MSVYIFAGPTLSAEEIRAELDAVCLPPVAQGDVYRIARLNPRAIGIVDGYFQRVPAVWHKEILWAMTEGIHVFGAASMGALRAAELAPFGMEGVGSIFEAYRDGVLRADDEVAVTHAPAELGYAAQSEAMVNIRATLAAAEREDVLRPATRMALEHIAKGQFYPDRTYPAILRLAAEQGEPAAAIATFSAWLPTGRVDQKRADAIAMLRRMRDVFAADPAPKQVTFRLEQTLQWERVTRFAGVAAAGADGDADTVRLEALLDELGLDGDAFPQAYQAALLSYLALGEGRRRGYAAGAADVEQIRAHLCGAYGLQGADDLDRWLRKNHLTRERFETLVREEVLRGRLLQEIDVEIVSQLPDHLRLVDVYSRLLARALDKRRALEARGLEHTSLEEAGLKAVALAQWYFARLQRPVPDDLDGYARAHGFGGADALLGAVLREYFYVSANPGRATMPARADGC